MQENDMTKLLWAALGLTLTLAVTDNSAAATPLWNAGLNVIPSPAECALGGEDFLFDGPVSIVVPATSASEELKFAAGDLAERLKSDFAIQASTGTSRGARNIVLSNGGRQWKSGQGYSLSVDAREITIDGDGAAGVFYGTRTLLQLIQPGRGGPVARGMVITDKPDIPIRAVHYDTKHHQDRLE